MRPRLVLAIESIPPAAQNHGIAGACLPQRRSQRLRFNQAQRRGRGDINDPRWRNEASRTNQIRRISPLHNMRRSIDMSSRLAAERQFVQPETIRVNGRHGCEPDLGITRIDLHTRTQGSTKIDYSLYMHDPTLEPAMQEVRRNVTFSDHEMHSRSLIGSYSEPSGQFSARIDFP